MRPNITLRSRCTTRHRVMYRHGATPLQIGNQNLLPATLSLVLLSGGMFVCVLPLQTPKTCACRWAGWSTLRARLFRRSAEGKRCELFHCQSVWGPSWSTGVTPSPAQEIPVRETCRWNHGSLTTRRLRHAALMTVRIVGSRLRCSGHGKYRDIDFGRAHSSRVPPARTYFSSPRVRLKSRA